MILGKTESQFSTVNRFVLLIFYFLSFQLQSKRELFFKNELPTSGGTNVPPQPPANGPTLGSTNTAPPPNPSAIKEAIAKRGKLL